MAVTDRFLCLFKNDGAKSEKENFSLFLVKLLIKHKFQPFSKRMIFYRIGVKKLLFLSLPVGAQTQTGLLVGGGSGNFSFGEIKPRENKSLRDVDYKLNGFVGYRFRLHPFTSCKAFVDLDASVGVKSWDYLYRPILKQQPSDNPNIGGLYTASSSAYACFASLGGTINCPVYKGLSVGAGVEPVYYFAGYEKEDMKHPFDVPFVGKIAYNLKFMELGISYKHGLSNVIETKDFTSGKFRDWQVSVWIPF